MPTTPLGFTYPADTDGPFGPLQIQQALTDVDTYLSLFVWRGRRRLTAFSIPDGTGGSYFSVPMDTLDLISSAGASLGTGPNTGLCAVPATGRYLVSGVVTFAASATGQRGCVIAVNGSAIDGDFQETNATTGGEPTRYPVAADIVFCSAGDVISLQAFQNTGSALNTAVAGPCRLLVARYPG